MNTPKVTHTPGPWEWGHSDTADEPFIWVSRCISDKTDKQLATSVEAERDPLDYYRQVGPDLSIACMRWGGENHDPKTEPMMRSMAEANARLISAAPDLLAACKMALEWAEAHGWHEVGCSEVRAAIAAADGNA